MSTLDGERHNLSDDSYVTFSGVKGMNEVNGKEFQITVFGKYTSQYTSGNRSK